uniref:Uncharacterized protein n=1 Tax=Cupriavidus metallidurans TaxID=119219 RepID=O51793_9BURK|nr:hypothetical protein [Cupriavidus metallidurans CH34]
MPPARRRVRSLPPRQLASASAVSRAANCARTSLSSSRSSSTRSSASARAACAASAVCCASRRRRTTSSNCTATAACQSARIASAISAGSSGRARSARPARTTSASMALSVRDRVAGSPPPRRSRTCAPTPRGESVRRWAAPRRRPRSAWPARWRGSGRGWRQGGAWRRVRANSTRHLTHAPNVRTAIFYSF